METRQALADGASEIDMVINLWHGKEQTVSTGDRRKFVWLKQEVGDKILKVIIETCYLTEEEKIEMCHAVTEAGAGFYQDIYRIWNRRSNIGRCSSDERAYRSRM